MKSQPASIFTKFIECIDSKQNDTALVKLVNIKGIFIEYADRENRQKGTTVLGVQV